MIMFMSKNEVIAYIPEIAAITGYAVGQALEQVSRNTIERNRQSLFPGVAGVPEQTPADTQDLSRQSVLQRGLAGLAIIGALAGYSLAEGFTPADKPKEAPTALTIVADHSYVTQQDNSVRKINALVASVADGKVKASVLVAHNASYSAIKSDELDQDQPFGPPSLKETTQVALNNANSQATGEKASAGVLVVTDGNSVGSVKSVTKEARSQGDVPILIANVGDANGSIVQSLKDIAKATKGEYWDASKQPSGAAERIKDRIKPHAILEQTTDSGDKNKFKIIGVVSLLLGGLQFRRRKSETAIS